MDDFRCDWADIADEDQFWRMFRPDTEASLDDAIVEFLAKVEDLIFDDYGAPEWTHKSTPLLQSA